MNLRINVATSYRVFFPVVTTAFVLLPFLGPGYGEGLAAGLYAVWSVAIMLMMVQCAQVSRDGGINPVFIYGVFGGIMYGLHDVGFLGGSLLEGLAATGMLGSLPPVALVTVAAVYLLGLMYFIGQGGFRRALADSAVNEIELLALKRKAGEAGSAEHAPTAPTPQVAAPLQQSEAAPLPPARDDGDTPYRDRFSKQMAAVREFFGLSAREAEVAELIARGNTVAHIAELLFVSENTVRTHSKRIYTKLDIHKRQELIELVESFEPDGR